MPTKLFLARNECAKPCVALLWRDEVSVYSHDDDAVWLYSHFLRAQAAFAYAALAAAPKLRNLVHERELNTCQLHQHIVRARAVFHDTIS